MPIPESRLAKSSKWGRTLRGLNSPQTFWTNLPAKAKRVRCGTFLFAFTFRMVHSCYLLGDANSYALQLLTPASILAGLSGRKQIEAEDVSEMNELFLDAKTSAAMIESGSFGGWDIWFGPRSTYIELSVRTWGLSSYSFSPYSLFSCRIFTYAYPLKGAAKKSYASLCTMAYWEQVCQRLDKDLSVHG